MGRKITHLGEQETISLEDDDIRDRIYSCTGCLSCEQQCGVYHHQHIFEIVQALRTEAVTQGFLNPAYMVMYYGLRKGVIKKTDIRQLFFDPWFEDGETIFVYHDLSKKLRKIRIPKRM